MGKGEFSARLQLADRHTDFVLGVSVVGIILLLILPIPSLLLDALLCLSIVLSVMALLLTLYIEKALEFSTFPSFLLFLTLYRLGLNIASTRMILTKGEGGDIIQTFGHFVISGNLIVGVILFSLLTLVNFVVVTKGAGRIAEVAARFQLEALPGKQMTIENELSSHLISQDDAKMARLAITQEADFFSAMEGASKFVKGDAIIGLIITFVNILGGLIVGLCIKKIDIYTCFSTYFCLTIGDGLISQIPALFTSVGAGIMVTRASSGKLGVALARQIFYHPNALFIGAVTILFLSFIPGMPSLIMVPMALLLFTFAFIQKKNLKKKPMVNENQFSKNLIEIRVSDKLKGVAKELHPQFLNLRDKIGKELGIHIPFVEITSDKNLMPNEWQMHVKGLSVYRESASDGTILISQIREKMEELAPEFLNRQDVVKMINNVKLIDAAVVEEIIPHKLQPGQFLKILQLLLKEKIPISNTEKILEILADLFAQGHSFDLEQLSEKVRQGLSNVISEKFFGATKVVYAITIDPKVEQMIRISQENLRQKTIEKLLETLFQFLEKNSLYSNIVVVTDPSCRLYLKKLISIRFPKLEVFSYKEIKKEVDLKTIGNIHNDILI